MKRNLLLTLFLLLPFFGRAIEIRSRLLTTNDGLTNNTATRFFQDSKGFIWIGTIDGLSRYDGNSFVSLRPDPDQAIPMADHWVQEVFEDQNGFLWISFYSDQFSCYDLRRECFVDFTGTGEYQQSYSKCFLAKNGDVWLWHTDGKSTLRRVTYQQGHFSSTCYATETSELPDNRINFVREDAQNHIWIATRKGLARWSEEKMQVIDPEANCPYSTLDEAGNLYFISQDNQILRYGKERELERLGQLSASTRTRPTGVIAYHDELILFTTTGVYTYNTDSHRVHRGNALFTASIISGSVIRDNRNNCWVYNHSGKIWYLNRQKGQVRAFTLIPKEKLGYVDHERYQVFHDSRDMIWITTYGNGLFSYLPEKDQLVHYSSDVDGNALIGTDFLQTVMEDRSGAIWIGSDYAGISQITVVTENIRRIYPQDRSLMDRSNTIKIIHKASDGTIRVGTRNGKLYTYDEQAQRVLNQQTFPSSIYTILEDSKGRLWYGSRGSGILLDGKWFRNDYREPQSLSNNHVFHLFEDSRGRIWIATFGGGVNLAEEREGEITFRRFLNEGGISQRQARIIGEDRNGLIWVGTNNGLYIFDPDQLLENPDNYHHYTYHNGLNSNDIRSIYRDRKGNMWVGTAGGLSLCYPEDYKALSFRNYTTREGLANNSVHSITEDHFGNLWIATQLGISRYWPTSNTFENYRFSIHNLGNVYSENSCCIGSNGELLFGTEHGLTVLDPATIRKTATPSAVVFVRMRINGVEMNAGDPESPLPQSLAYSDQVVLKHTQNTFVIDFSTFDFAALSPPKYTYRLDPYDKNWNEVSPINFASYKNLPPGNYQLRVKASNNSGELSLQETSLAIRITPPFWQTTFAIILFSLILAGALYLGYRVMRNFTRLQQKIRIEEELMEYKLVFFTNISHEFRTPLTLIQGGVEKIKRKASTLPKEIGQPLQTIEKSTKRMVHLIDQLIEFRKMQHKKLFLALERMDVIAFLREIFDSFVDIAESKEMDYYFKAFTEHYEACIDRGKVEKIVYNLLSNAFKYTPSGGVIALIIKAREEDAQLIIEVADTGIGISKEVQAEMFKRYARSKRAPGSTGIGLHLTHELVGTHKGTIRYAEHAGGGSRFIVSLPLSPGAYEQTDFLTPHPFLKETVSPPILCQTEAAKEGIPKKNRSTLSKILVIEDDYDVRQFLYEELSPHFDTEVVEDGESGLEKARKREYDLILCDVMMPGIDGLEVTRRLKADFYTSHLPVVLLTALGREENHIEGLQCGADAYITKPFHLDVLLNTLSGLIGQREKLRQKYAAEAGIIPPALPASEQDRLFIEKLNEVVEENIGNVNFSVDDFALAMKLGRTVFYKKVKGLTGYSPNEYVRVIRLKKAAELLQTGGFTVAEVTYQIGISNPFYFSKCFKEQFGVAPSFYQKGKESMPKNGEN